MFSIEVIRNSSLWVPWVIWPLAIFLCLLLAAIATPRRWWRKPTVLGLLGLSGGSFLLAQVLLQALPGAAPQPIGLTQVVGTARTVQAAIEKASNQSFSNQASSSQQFKVHQALNLRRQAGTDAPLITILPAGSRVWLTGKRDGDWWQVRTLRHSGWVSSLWLRQTKRTP
jgi:hypothetical protein